MSSYFDKGVSDLCDWRNKTIPCDPEFRAWRDQFVLHILGRCQMTGDYLLPDKIKHQIYTILGRSTLVDWPYGTAGEPDPADEEAQWGLLQRGISDLHTLFHEIGYLHGSDDPRIWIGEAENQVDDFLRRRPGATQFVWCVDGQMETVDGLEWSMRVRPLDGGDHGYSWWVIRHSASEGRYFLGDADAPTLDAAKAAAEACLHAWMVKQGGAP